MSAAMLACLAGRVWRDRGSSGASALEFALVAPLFLLLIGGVVIYGTYFASWIAVTEAASEAARASLAGMSTAERQSLATATANQIFSDYGPLLTASCMTMSFPAPPAANRFSVQVTYDFTTSGIATFMQIVPLPTLTPTIVITVSNGGY